MKPRHKIDIFLRIMNKILINIKSNISIVYHSLPLTQNPFMFLLKMKWHAGCRLICNFNSWYLFKSDIFSEFKNLYFRYFLNLDWED